MKKNVLLVLALIALVAGSAFAQKVGDMVTLSGQDYSVTNVNDRDGTVTLQVIEKIEGIYDRTVGGNAIAAINFSNDRAVITEFDKGRNVPPEWRGAVDKRVINVGDQYIRNIKATGATTWSCEIMELGPRGVIYEKGTITMQSNGDLTLSIQSNRGWRVEFKERPDPKRQQRRRR